jgi:hypothetical protein
LAIDFRCRLRALMAQSTGKMAVAQATSQAGMNTSEDAVRPAA